MSERFGKFEIKQNIIMKKILVTTDFSPSSRSAIYFAIQLASQDDCSLTFFHSYHVLMPTSWNKKKFESFEHTEAFKIEKKLQRLVESIYKRSGLKPGNHQFVISKSLSPEKNIIDYAAGNGFDFICVSRRGQAIHKNIFGTVTSGLINKSAVPIIAVPPNYKPKKLSKLLYVSDLTNLEKEINRIISFSEQLRISLELLHFRVPSDPHIDDNLIDKASKKFLGHQIKLHLRDFNFSETLVKNIDKVISVSKPSMVVMFTQQHRDFFSRLFLPGVTPSYAFKARVPLLIFSKTEIKKG